VLEAFDRQMRGTQTIPLADGERLHLLGPLVCVTGSAGRGFVDYCDLGGLEGAALDDLIASCVAAYAGRGEEFEWKTFAHDLPSDLTERLRAAGFVPEDIAGEPVLPDGVSLREVTSRADLDRIARFEATVWGEERTWLAEMLDGELKADAESLRIAVVEAGGEVVCAAWIRFGAGTEFATLWGGATAPAWRRRGIYRATVAHRANLAAERGFTYLEVDASDDSRPILERLGFTAVTTTTPYIWSPPS
jgi:GNAT superfamily N-acetyltransferase